MTVVPLPPVLRRVPSLANEGEPVPIAKAFPSPSRSRVALGLLLKRAVLKATSPLVHVAAPLFTNVSTEEDRKSRRSSSGRHWQRPPGLTLRFRSSRQSRQKAPIPTSPCFPEEFPMKDSKTMALDFRLPLKNTLPPLTMSGALLMVQVPSKAHRAAAEGVGAAKCQLYRDLSSHRPRIQSCLSLIPAPGASVALPFIMSEAPGPGVKVPVLSATVSTSVPLLT